MQKVFLSFSLILCIVTSSSGQKVNDSKQEINNKSIENKMKIEIWSDVMCPFCYIGKRKFEIALEHFEHKDNVEIIWKSYQLMPDLKTDLTKSVNQLLVEAKGLSMDQVVAMNAQVTQMAEQVGLEYHLDKSIPSNTLNAHRFTHFAKSKGKQNEAEERLFKAYFTEAKNVDDLNVLLQLGKDIGLNTEELKTVLEDGNFATEVQNDIAEAQQIGVRGVPFFVFNRKQAVSGAQDPSIFLKALEETYAVWRKENPEVKLEVIEGQVCKPDGTCD